MTAALADASAERAWLACVLLDATTLEAAPVRLDDFYDRKHALLGATMAALRARNESIAPGTVRAELVLRGDYERAGGDALLFGLMNPMPTVSDAVSHARAIRQHARLRAMASLFERGRGAAAVRDFDAVAEIAREIANARGDGEDEDRIFSFAEMLAEGVEAAIHKRERGQQIRFGTPAVDHDYTPTPGHLVIVAGRPNVGKTSLTFAWHVSCAERGIPSGIVSVDDDVADYGARGCGAISGVNPSTMWTSDRLDAATLQKILAGIDRNQHKRPIAFAAVRSRSIDAVCSTITRMARTHGARWVSVDFITKIRAPGKDQRERTDEALQRLGELAAMLQIPIVVLAQIKRLGDKPFREPQLDDLKESGRLEEDAQAVVLLWRDSDTIGAPVRAKLAKVKRTGAGRRFTLIRHPETGLLVESAEHREERRDAYDQ